MVYGTVNPSLDLSSKSCIRASGLIKLNCSNAYKLQWCANVCTLVKNGKILIEKQQINKYSAYPKVAIYDKTAKSPKREGVSKFLHTTMEEC